MYRDNFTSTCLDLLRTTFHCVEQCDNCDWQVWSEWTQNVLDTRICRCNRGFRFCGMWSWIDGPWTIGDEGGKFLRNVGSHSPSDAALQPKQRISTCLRSSYWHISSEKTKIFSQSGRSQSQFSNPFRISSNIQMFSLGTCPCFILPFLGSLIQYLNTLSSKIHENIALNSVFRAISDDCLKEIC